MRASKGFAYVILAVLLLVVAVTGWVGSYATLLMLGVRNDVAVLGGVAFDVGLFLWIHTAAVRPPAWLVRRRVRRQIRQMAWPGKVEWRGMRWAYIAVAVWTVSRIWLGSASAIDLFVQLAVIWWCLRCYRSFEGLTYQTKRALRGMRKDPWSGYDPRPRRCAQCKGTGMLPSRISPDVSYPCNACRSRNVPA
ncbi:MAG: hypothetical protein ABW167_07810 [Baekduia sp.]